MQNKKKSSKMSQKERKRVPHRVVCLIKTKKKNAKKIRKQTM